MIYLKNYFVNTTADMDVLSVIHEVNRTIRESNIPDGLVTITVPEGAAALVVLELLPDIIEGFKEQMIALSSEGKSTRNRRKEEIDIGPRVSAAFLGNALHLPVHSGKLVIGIKQEPVLVDFEKRVGRREFYVQVIGEAPQTQAQQQGPMQRR